MQFVTENNGRRQSQFYSHLISVYIMWFHWNKWNYSWVTEVQMRADRSRLKTKQNKTLSTGLSPIEPKWLKHLLKCFAESRPNTAWSLAHLWCIHKEEKWIIHLFIQKGKHYKGIKCPVTTYPHTITDCAPQPVHMFSHLTLRLLVFQGRDNLLVIYPYRTWRLYQDTYKQQLSPFPPLSFYLQRHRTKYYSF